MRAGLAVLVWTIGAAETRAFLPERDDVAAKRREPPVAVRPAFRRGRTVVQEEAAEQAVRDGLRVEWDGRTGAPDRVRGTDLSVWSSLSGGPKARTVDPADFEGRARAVLDNLSALYAVREAHKEFVMRRLQQDRLGHHHVRLNQMYRGLRVVGADMVVHFDASGRSYQVNGRYMPELSVKTGPKLSRGGALFHAQTDLARRGYPKGAAVAGPELVVFALVGRPVLAYELVLVFTDVLGRPGRWRYWIDAVDGQVLNAYSDLRRINPPSVGGSSATITGNVLAGEGSGSASVTGWAGSDGYHYLWDSGRHWFVYNTDTGTYARRASSSWGVNERTEISAARNFEWCQRYFSTVHGRNSFNGSGANACVNIHEGTSYANAYWDGQDFHFGDGDGYSLGSLVVLDVSGHELTHAVTQYSADLIYQNESGALNEAFSDIFGVLIEFYFQPDGSDQYPNAPAGYADWMTAEDCSIQTKAMRDLRDPANVTTVGVGNQLPSRYKGTYWYYGTGDNGGVHYNLSVQTHFFYLLCEGGSGNNDGIAYAVTGIGRDNAARVAYRALTVYCTQTTDYSAARGAWVSAAQDLNAAWVSSVEAAWAAVGVGSAPASRVATPSFSPPGGSYESAQTVTITTATAGAAITYTLNGSEPTASSMAYTGPIQVSADAAFKAKAFKAGMDPSLTATVSYDFLGTKIHDFPMTTDPGWTAEGQWAFGAPTGSGGEHGYADPASGYTGPNVYGYNLAGDYANDLAATHWLTTKALDLSSVSDAALTFRRWLGVERPAYDHAYLEVSNDGSSWTRLWENSTEVDDSEWVYLVYDISAVADRQATVYVRWGLGATDASWVYCGWNIDDVQVWGTATAGQVPAPPSDLTASAASGTRVDVSWQDKSNNEQGFTLERKTLSTAWAALASVGANVESYADTSVAAETTYTYRVRAYNTVGASDYSAEAQVTTPAAGSGDIWDPVDDTGAGATTLTAPTGSGQTHGSHTLSGTDLGDWFKVSLQAGESYNFNSVGGSGDTYATLYSDPSGTTEVAADDDSGGGLQFSLNYAPSASAWYYLRVRTFTVGSTATYSLQYQRTDVSSDDVWDPTDDDPAGATALSLPGRTAQTHGPHTLSDSDWYDGFWVYLTAGTRYNFRSTAAWGDTLADLYWQDSDGTWYWLDEDDDSGGALQFSLSYRCIYTDWYYLDVLTYTLGSQASYTLRYGIGDRARQDFDGNGASDLGVYVESTGNWFVFHDGGSTSVVQWGYPGARCLSGDFDGDGLTDFAVFDVTTGRWFIRTLANNILAQNVNWGWPGVEPVAGDFDGDGSDDLAVFDQNTGRWFIRKLNGTVLALSVFWGWPGVTPVPGDYDGDGLDDLAVFDQNTGRWFIRRLDGKILGWSIFWGWPGVSPVPGDFDGDGLDDLAIFDQNTGRWFIRKLDGTVLAWKVFWGWPGVQPLSGDYDGDGMDDLAVYDWATGDWFIRSLAYETPLANPVNWGCIECVPVGAR